jgi:peptide deformylase
MSLLNILQFPDPRLRTQAKPVTEFNAKLRTLADDMLSTMYAAPGIGLAATQVDVHQRVIVVDVSENRDEPFVLINPELTLSGAEFDAQTFTAEGLLAVCIQHECDHLEGKLFVDYLSGLKRNRIRKKLIKQQKQPL